jgi:hypothetical protein
VPELDAPLAPDAEVAPEALPVCEVPAFDDPLEAPLTTETSPADEPAELPAVEAPEPLP